MASGAHKHIFVHSLWSGLHFALTKTTAICVYFSVASPKVYTNFEQNLTRSLHFIGFTFEVGGAYRLTWVWAIAATHWGKRTQIWDQ